MDKSRAERFRDKVKVVFAERFGEAARRLDDSVDDLLLGAIVRAFPDLSPERARDLAFHLSDWRSDGAFLVALSLEPERFTPEEVEAGVLAFLIHAPNHIAAAAKLGGFPVSDIFGVGALDGGRT